MRSKYTKAGIALITLMFDVAAFATILDNETPKVDHSQTSYCTRTVTTPAQQSRSKDHYKTQEVVQCKTAAFEGRTEQEMLAARGSNRMDRPGSNGSGGGSRARSNAVMDH